MRDKNTAFYRGNTKVLVDFSAGETSSDGAVALLKPELCIRSSITSLTHFKSVALLCLPSHHSGAMLSKSNCLIYCDLKPHHESYCIIQVEPFYFGIFSDHETYLNLD